MIEAHRLDQSRVFNRISRVLAVFFQKAPREETSHKGPAPEIQPDPGEGEAFRVRNRHDVERKINPVHQPRPNAKWYHVLKDVLHIDAQERQERNEEMAENNHQPDIPPCPPLTNDIP